jgi:hypothetical protein
VSASSPPTGETEQTARRRVSGDEIPLRRRSGRREKRAAAPPA